MDGTEDAILYNHDCPHRVFYVLRNETRCVSRDWRYDFDFAEGIIIEINGQRSLAGFRPSSVSILLSPTSRFPLFTEIVTRNQPGES